MSTHALLIFKDQKLTTDDLMTINKKFDYHNESASYDGSFGFVGSKVVQDQDNPEVQIQGNMKELAQGSGYFNEGYHSDGMHCMQYQLPVLTSMLCKSAPTSGGETFFLCGRRIYRNLTRATQILCEHIQMRYVYDPSQLERVMRNGIVRVNQIRDSPAYRYIHPLVRVHCDTGEKSIYLSCGNVVGLNVCGVDWNAQEAYQFIDFLLKDEEKNRFAHIWQDNDFVI